MANLKFSQFTEQTDTSNVQFIVGYNGATNVRISPANIIDGTVTSVTTGNSNTITIGGTSAAPTVAANTAAVTNGSANLATGDQIYDFVIGEGYTTNTGTVESVGLSMPAAFSVASSPVTTSGTLTVTGAGTTSQYIRGDGTLNTFPTIPTVPTNIVETVTTTDGDFIDLTPNTATDGAVTVTADLSATGTPSSSNYLRGDNTWATIPGGFTSFDITGGSGSAQTITDGNTITLAQGAGISTVAGATDTVTITNTDTGSSQNIFKNVASDSGTAVADNNNDTLTIAGGTNVSTAVVGDTLTITATDTNTTYTAGTGLTLSGTVFNTNVDGTQSTAANTSTTTAARTYKVQVDSSDNLVVNVPWTSGSSGIAGTISTNQVAFGNGTDTIAGSDDFAWNGNTLTLGGSTGTGNLSAVLITGDAFTCNNNMNLGTVIQHQGDSNTKFGFPANDTFTIETNGLERLRIASAGQIGIGGTNYGTAGNVLTSNGASAAPSWQAAGGGNEFASGLYIGGTASANLLEDYEKGTFTPTITSSVATNGGLEPGSGDHAGYYERVGEFVTVGFALQFNGSPSNVTVDWTLTSINNLPFIVRSVNSTFDNTPQFLTNNSTGTNRLDFGGYALRSTTKANFVEAGSATQTFSIAQFGQRYVSGIFTYRTT